MDIKNSTTQIELLPLVTRTSSANGSAVDLQDFIGRIAIMLHSEIGSGTSPTQDVKIQDSADGSTGWADISGAAFDQVTDSAAAFESIGLEIDTAKRYLRAVNTIGGTTPSFAAGVTIVGRKQNN